MQMAMVVCRSQYRTPVKASVAGAVSAADVRRDSWDLGENSEESDFNPLERSFEMSP